MAVNTKRAPGIIRKQQIKKATLDIIHEEGLKKLSTRNLAQYIHMSEGAIFRHFHTKNDIILSIMEDVRKDLLEPLKHIVTSNKSPEKRLEEFICFHISYLEKNEGITILLFTEATYENNKLMKNQLVNFFSLIKQYFGKIIHDGIASETWNISVPVDSLATLYMGIPITMNIEMNLNPKIFTYNNFCNEMMDLIKRIIEN